MADDFVWKNQVKAAVSFSFDDARVSQVDCGLAIFEAFDARATFYVSHQSIEKRPEGWEIAVRNGHEIGNHTVNHPCSGNFSFARDTALEEYNLEMMSEELNRANTKIETMLKVRPTTFAYPCGQTFVGRGEATRSYVPLVAKRFLAGRGFLSECANDPRRCDLAQLAANSSDNCTASVLIKLIETAVKDGSWLIFAGHEIGNPKSHQNTMAGALRTVLAYIRQNSNDIWLDTVAEIASYIGSVRSDGTKDNTQE